jgi:hypothetical protein
MTCVRRDAARRLARHDRRCEATAARADKGSLTGPRAVQRMPTRPS